MKSITSHPPKRWPQLGWVASGGDGFGGLRVDLAKEP